MDVGIETFRLARAGSEGYDKAEVDEFVGEVRAALSRRPPSMAPWEVRDKRFRTQRVHRGYDEETVDAFLDKAEFALRQAHGYELRDPHDDRPRGQTNRVLWALAAFVVLALVMAGLLFVA